jgi:hypothetical protein
LRDGIRSPDAQGGPKAADDLEPVLEIVRLVEEARGTHEVELLARRFLGQSDDQLVITVGAAWWPILRSLDTWRHPADVLIAAEAAISALSRSSRPIDQSDQVGLEGVLRMLARILAGGHGYSNAAVARTAVLVWHLCQRPAEEVGNLLDDFVAEVRRAPGTNTALRALDRAARSHQDDAVFVERIATLARGVAKVDPPLEPWFPGSYVSRLTRVLGHFGGDGADTVAIAELRRLALLRGNSLTVRRECAWALLETIRTDVGWTAWQDVAGKLRAEDEGRAVPEFTALHDIIPSGATRAEGSGTLEAANARKTGVHRHLDLVNARVWYIVDGRVPVASGAIIELEVPAPVLDLLKLHLPRQDTRLRRMPGWQQCASGTRSSMRSLLIETLLSPSVIRADTAVETLLASGPSVREACRHTVTRIVQDTLDKRAAPTPQWFRERLVSVIGFLELLTEYGRMLDIAQDRDQDPYLRARSILVIGELLSAWRTGDRRSSPEGAAAAAGVRSLLPTGGPGDAPPPVQVAAVRAVGLFGDGTDRKDLLVLGHNPPAWVTPEVERMAAWAVDVLKRPFG